MRQDEVLQRTLIFPLLPFPGRDSWLGQLHDLVELMFRTPCPPFVQLANARQRYALCDLLRWLFLLSLSLLYWQLVFHPLPVWGQGTRISAGRFGLPVGQVSRQPPGTQQGKRRCGSCGVAPAVPPAPVVGGVAGPASATGTLPVRPGLQVRPTRVIAPVGSEVVLAAGVGDQQGQFLSGEQIQWLLSQGGVGEIVALGDPGGLIPIGPTRKVDNDFAITTASRRTFRLTRGTPTPVDDLTILRGQAWITLTSPVEGISYVTAFAPDVRAWDLRRDRTQVIWVDAQWVFPPAATNPVGTPHQLVTTVTRSSDQQPIEGWQVRYEVLDGPQAGFGPDQVRLITTTTDSRGQARAQLTQVQTVAGTNQIRVQVLRPASAPTSGGTTLLLGDGLTTKTWTAAQLSISKTGPAQAAVGAEVTYTIEVVNNGNATAGNVQVVDSVPTGTTYVSSLPAAQVDGRSLRWSLGDIGAGQRRTIELRLRLDAAGVINVPSTATAEGDLTAEDSAATTVTEPTVELRLSGPERVQVGQRVTFRIEVTNTGEATATGLLLSDRFDEGLQAPGGFTSPIERRLEDITSGSSRSLGVTFTVNRTGRLCQTVRLIGDGGVDVSKELCVTAEEPPPSPQANLEVQARGPESLEVGELELFDIIISNNGQQAAGAFVVRATFDFQFLAARQATDRDRRPVREPIREVVWDVPQLEPNRSVRLQIQFEALAAAQRACNRVSVTTTEGRILSDEVCVQIRPSPPPQLELNLQEFRDPVPLNEVTTYQASIRNTGTSTARQLQLSINLPAAMQLVDVAPGNPTGVASQRRGVLKFLPLSELAPGQTIDYEFRIRGVLAGEATILAGLEARSLARPIVTSETTDVSPPFGQ